MNTISEEKVKKATRLIDYMMKCPLFNPSFDPWFESKIIQLSLQEQIVLREHRVNALCYSPPTLESHLFEIERELRRTGIDLTREQIEQLYSETTTKLIKLYLEDFGDQL